MYKTFSATSLPVLNWLFLLVLLFCITSCSNTETPDTVPTFSGTITDVYQHSTLGIEKLGVIEVKDKANNFEGSINITITAKTKIIEQDKRKSFEALRKGQQVAVWLKNEKTGLLHAQVTATHVLIQE
ncbi:MAG: hypothetical protein LPK19_04845 [Hymenobacteraceae bacterium]|nr:hypothetical protein [Hymenobacteraceae bacterium]MDX5395522.1 hypothetical protein [Hymenobacteraceae bacterium]MDX5511576.1 hypothetical protein [Hymenobacteraceae bacterium]